MAQILLQNNEKLTLNKEVSAGDEVSASAIVQQNQEAGGNQAKLMVTGDFNIAQQHLYKAGSEPYNAEGKLIDYSGEGNDAELSGTRNIADFTKLSYPNSYYALKTNVNLLKFPSPDNTVTIEFEFSYGQTIVENNISYLFSYGDVTADNLYITISKNKNYAGGFGYLRLGAQDSNGNKQAVDTNIQYNDTNWHKIRAIFSYNNILVYEYSGGVWGSVAITTYDDSILTNNYTYPETIYLCERSNLVGVRGSKLRSLKYDDGDNSSEWIFQSGTTTFYDIGTAGNNLTATNANVYDTEVDALFYSLKFGFTDVAGVKVPYGIDGNPIVESGTNHPAGNWHNGAETKITLQGHGAKTYDELKALAISDNRFELVEDEDGNISELKVSKLTETDTEHYTADNNSQQTLTESGNLISPIDQTVKLLIQGGDNENIAASKTFTFTAGAEITITAATSGEDGNNIQIVFVVGGTRGITVVEGSTIIITLTYEAGDDLSDCTDELDSVATLVTYSIDTDGALSDDSGSLEGGFTPAITLTEYTVNGDGPINVPVITPYEKN